MSKEDQMRLHARLQGRVQGVGFRYFVQRTAEQLGITGWVRNRWDGSVEVLAEADRSVLDRFLAALRRGPPGSNVADDQVDWKQPGGEFSSFMIRRTQ